MMSNYTKYYGVCDSIEFKKRLNIFVNGVNEENILKYIDWNNCAIVGSAIAACGMKYNPLIDLCKLGNNANVITDNDYKNYYFHYYMDSDVDLLIKNREMVGEDGFLGVVDTLINKLNTNGYNTKITSIKTGCIIISEELISIELENIQKIFNNTNISISSVKKMINDIKLKEYLYNKYYVDYKNEQQNIIEELNKKNSIIYTQYLDKIPISNLRIIILNYDIEETKIKKLNYEKYIFLKDINKNTTEKNKLVCKLTESIRFKVCIPDVRELEIFKSKRDNFMSTISLFHLNCVKGYWNGKTVKCLPSYITSMMLQLSLNYNYFSSIRNPVDIINKYKSRGFGIILNNQEKSYLRYHNMKSDNKWSHIYNNAKDMFGPKSSNDKVFKYSKIVHNFPDDCYQNVNHDTINKLNACLNLIKRDENSNNFLKLKAINDDGSICPIDRNIYKTAYKENNK